MCVPSGANKCESTSEGLEPQVSLILVALASSAKSRQVVSVMSVAEGPAVTVLVNLLSNKPEIAALAFNLIAIRKLPLSSVKADEEPE